MAKRNRKTERNNEICSLRSQGMNYKKIADKFEISIIRVRQIIEAGGSR